MSRPRSYDRKTAVEQACKAFWTHGYQSLGVREIESITGINQYAIRSEFGGKEGLYLEALKFYSDAAISNAMVPLKNGGLAEIITFLESLVTKDSIMSSNWGCLIVNTGIENARVNSPQLDKAVKYYWSTLENHFEQSLKNAYRRREIETQTNLHTLATALVTVVMGVHTKNRAARSFDGGSDLIELICDYLNSLKTT